MQVDGKTWRLRHKPGYRHGELDDQQWHNWYVGRTNTRPIVPEHRKCGTAGIFPQEGMPLHSSMRPRPRRPGKLCHWDAPHPIRPRLCAGGPLFTRLRSVPGSHDLGTFASSSGCGGMLGLTWCIGRLWMMLMRRLFRYVWHCLAQADFLGRGQVSEKETGKPAVTPYLWYNNARALYFLEY